MSFVLLHKLVTYLIAALGLYALTLGGELGIAVQGLIVVAYLGSFFAEGDRVCSPGWVRGWNAAVVAFFVFQAVRGVLGGPFLALGIEYAAFLQLSRLFNRASAKDYQHIAILAFLHLIAATVLSTDLAYGFVFVGFVITTPWMLVLSQLRSEIEGKYQGGRRKGETGAPLGPDVRRVLASRRIVGPGFLLGTAALTLPIFLLTVGLFLAFPRVGLGFLSFGGRGGQRTAGFGRNIELGDFGVIRDDPTVVMRIKLGPLDEDGQSTPAPAVVPAQLALRMRGTSFDHYDGRRWTRTTAQSVAMRSDGEYFPIRRQALLQDAQLQVILDRLDEPVLFLPERAVGVTIPPRVAAAEDHARQVNSSAGGDYRYVDDDGLGLRYTVYASSDAGEVFVDELDADERGRYLALPERIDRVAALAAGLTTDATTDRERAAVIQAHLRDSGLYRYSLEMPPVGDGDPLEAFLFEARYGHCEYYSTAMSVMLRSLGVPTRNVTGFAGATYNPYGGYYAVRQGDAHSWVEAHLDGRWVTFDPTPPARGELAVDVGFMADVRAMMDAIRTRWASDIVGYDIRSQVNGLRRVFRFLWKARRAVSSLVDDGGHAPDAAPSPRGPLSPWAMFAGAFVLLGLGGWVVARLLRRRSRRRETEESPTIRIAVSLYRDLEKALRRRGHPRPDTRTPREHAESLRALGFAPADVVDEVTARYEASRWGAEVLTDADLHRLRREISRIGENRPASA
ncbi:MAG: DUF3488 domain-containing protein [Deltaproteobacteria bacterium]|nr:DUF3488 domain-containing protein [Deltaproteobacteria bacterium]